MSGPQLKVQVSYDNPNIQANVPGQQMLRDDKNNNHTKVPGEHNDVAINASGTNVHKDNSESSSMTSFTREDSYREENLELADGESFVLTPVMTVTKQEAVFTKGDLKLQKISVTEDISVRFQHLFKKQTAPGKTVVTEIQKFEYKY